MTTVRICLVLILTTVMANNFTWSVPFSFKKMPIHSDTLSSENTYVFSDLMPPKVFGAVSVAGSCIEGIYPWSTTLTGSSLWSERCQVVRFKPLKTYENTPPVVTIISPEENRIFPWGAQVRYEISVSDAEDGESGYGEITPNEILLEIEYRAVSDSSFSSSNYAEEIAGQSADLPAEASAQAGVSTQAGLSNIRKSACFNCHADKTTLVGPSFSQIAERYEENQATVQQMARHISEGSTGIWGESVMPPHPQFTLEETKEMAEYILEQGSDSDRWVYPGLEGVFRIMEKPREDQAGLYILTASYLDNGIEGAPDSALRGESSIVIRIGE